MKKSAFLKQTYNSGSIDPTKIDQVKKYKNLLSMNEETSLTKTLNRKNWDRLDEVTKDLLELYFITDKTQPELAIIFGVSQGNISNALRRGVEAVRWMDNAPDKPDSFEEDVIRSLDRNTAYTKLPSDIKLKVVQYYLLTLHQSKTGYNFNLTQVEVRQILHKVLKCLKIENKTESESYLKYHMTNPPAIGYHKHVLHPRSIKCYSDAVRNGEEKLQRRRRVKVPDNFSAE